MAKRKRYPLGDHGLAYVLAGMFLFSWIGQFVFELLVVRDEAHDLGQPFSWSQFWPHFGQSTFENWQSEFLQVFTFVVITTFLIFRGSHESRDNDDEVAEQLNRIERQLEELRTKEPSAT
jgi:hypothetical protein